MRKDASSRREAVSASTRSQYAASSAAAAAADSAPIARIDASGMPSRRSHATSRACSSCAGA